MCILEICISSVMLQCLGPRSTGLLSLPCLWLATCSIHGRHRLFSLSLSNSTVGFDLFRENPFSHSGSVGRSETDIFLFLLAARTAMLLVGAPHASATFYEKSTDKSTSN